MANLERELAKRKWKKTDLARASGLSPSTLYPIWEKNVWPQPQTLSKIADGLGISVASLISRGHLVTPKQALDIVSEAVSLAQKLGPALVARLSAMDETEISDLETALSDRPILNESGSSASQSEDQSQHHSRKGRHK